MSPDSRELVLFCKLNFEHFSSLPGSQHIASRSSAFNLLELLIYYKPERVLDWGSGIGTLIPLYDFVDTSIIVAVEKNQWCRDQFITNTEVFKGIILTDDLPDELAFNLVSIDDDIDLITILRLISSNRFPKVVFIEGWRNRTVAKISFIILLRGLSAHFTRGKDRSQEFELGEREKCGAFFELSRRNNYHFLNSWVKRRSKTHEFRELRNFLLHTLGIFRLLSFLKMGTRIRSILKLSKKRREKYWRSEF